MTQHKSILSENQHIIHRWSVNTETALNTLAPITEDLYKLAFVTDTSTFFVLTSISPITWKPVGSDKVSSATQTALDTKVNTSIMGVANGIATLDSNGLVPTSQLPSYVDDVLEFATLPATGEMGKIYVNTTNNTTYRWSGSAFVAITSGAVSSVAGKTGVVTLTSADVGLGNVNNTADSAKSVASAATLTTARTINGVSFNGSANITITDSTKQATLVSGTSIKTVNGVTLLGSGDISTSTYDGMAIDLDCYLARQPISSVTYDANNKPTLISYANTYSVAISYVASGNGTGEIFKMIYKKSTTTIYTITYVYDASNRISSTTVA